MNILQIISGGETGGSKKHLLSLVENVDKEKHKCIIICFIKGRLYEEAIDLGLDIRLVEQNRRFDLSIVSIIADICKKEKISIINCHGGRANFIGYFLKRKYPAKYFTTVHSDYRDDYRGNRYKTFVYSTINSIVMKTFDYYITVSQDFKDMLIQRGYSEDKIFIVYNGIDFDVTMAPMYRDDIIEKYKLPEASHYVSIIARFHPVKGHKLFLDACKKVLESFRDVCFIMVGDGDIKKDLVNYIKELDIEEHISLVGWQKPEEFIFLSDFTVMTSYTESFPLAILESTLQKKTVISTEVGGIPMLIENEVNGYLVKPGESNELAERMLELLNNPDRAVDMGKRIYSKASENYSVKNLVDSYINAYTKVTSEEKNA